MPETLFSQHTEDLLQAWINMSVMIRGNRMVSNFSFNEIVVCRILFSRLSDGEPVTASELCQRMQLLKSQINKILTSMESRGYVERRRSETDKRKIEIHLTESAIAVYEQEHERILSIIRHVEESLGDEQARTLTCLLNQTVEAIEQMEGR